MAFFFFGPSLGLRAGCGEGDPAEVPSGVSVRFRLGVGVVADGFFLSNGLEGPACMLGEHEWYYERK